MRHHRAFGLEIESLDVVVVDDSKPMQTILRSMLNAARVGRVRVFDNAEEAFQSMLVETPNLLITDWHMTPTDGLALIRAMRSIRMGPMALVPAILVTGHPTRRLVEAAVRTSVHFVIAKPIAPSTLLRRIEAVTVDKRCFVADEPSGTFKLEGTDEVLAAQRERWAQLHGAWGDTLTLESVAEITRRRRRPTKGAASLESEPTGLAQERLEPPAFAPKKEEAASARRPAGFAVVKSGQHGAKAGQRGRPAA